MATHNNIILQYGLIACLGLSLLFAQTFKSHMHIQHDENHSSAATEHIIDIHVSSAVHDSQHDTDIQFADQDHHDTIVIEAGTSSFVKKAGLLNPFIFLFVISFILSVPRLLRYRRNRDTEIVRPQYFYLFHPPLRAPPLLSLRWAAFRNHGRFQ